MEKPLADADDFAKVMFSLVSDFRNHWFEKSGEDSAAYPETMTSDEWHEQFECWLSMQVNGHG